MIVGSKLKNRIFKKLVQSMKPLAPVFDLLLSPFTLLSVIWFRVVRYWGIKNLRITQQLFLRLGLIPVVDHYYEPLIDYRQWPDEPRRTGLKFDGKIQLEFIGDFAFQDELLSIPLTSSKNNEYHYQNGSFGSGDGELYYSIIRYYKPSRILEVGSGFSTLLALKAIDMTRKVDPAYSCEVTCIEPYEMPFLESLPVRLIRKKVESVDPAIFSLLLQRDILFVDSSHIIRPGGDVNFLILEVLSGLNAGVLIHFHDIFTPYHYPVGWLKDEYRLWNEQYLLEAFLLNNPSFEIVFGINYMKQNHGAEIYEKFPILKKEPGRLPGSLWLRKIK